MTKNNIALSFDFTSDYDRKFSIEFTTNTNGQKQLFIKNYAEEENITLTEAELREICACFTKYSNL